MIASRITLEQVIKSYMNRTGETDLSRYLKYKQIIIEEYGLMSKNVPYLYKHLYIDIPDSGIYEIPADCVDLYRIGRILNGNIEPLWKNNDIVLVDNATDPKEVVDKNYVHPVDYSYSGNGTASLQFRYNQHEKTIYFQGRRGEGQIYIEYMCTGIEDEKETLIPREFAQVLYLCIERSIELYENKNLAKSTALENQINHLLKINAQQILSSSDDLRNEMNSTKGQLQR